jgi:flagellar biosynthesis/type III secretory pathway protein FliH
MNKPAGADGEILPPEPNLRDVVAAVVVALSKLPGADALLIGRAQATLEGKYAEGFRRGSEHGVRRGYQLGYSEGLDEGRREVLDRQAAEIARDATLKAAARARRGG